MDRRITTLVRSICRPGLVLSVVLFFGISVDCRPAPPTFVSAGNLASNIGAITPGMPPGVLEDDILFLFVETADQVITVDSGEWIEVVGSPRSATNSTRLTVLWTRASQDAPTPPTISDSGDHQIGRIIAVRGATPTGNPWDVTSGGSEVFDGTALSFPGATTTVANTLVVVAVATHLPDSAGTANFSGWANGDLDSLTEQTDNTATAGNGGGLGIATGVKLLAGSYGETSVSLAVSAQAAFMTIAVAPGSGLLFWDGFESGDTSAWTVP